MKSTVGCANTGLTLYQNDPVAMGSTSEMAMLAASSMIRSTTASERKAA